MQSYRIYFFSADGHIKNCRDAECASERAAGELAGQLLGGWAAVEVWSGDRMVHRIGTRFPSLSDGGGELLVPKMDTPFG